MSSGTGWGAIAIAVIALVGTAYTAWTSKAAARESARVPTFESITSRLDLERERREHELTEVKERLSRAERSQRVLLGYVRDLREAIRRAGAEPPRPPADLDLSPWDSLDP